MSDADESYPLLDLLRVKQILSETNTAVLKRFAQKWRVSGFHAALETNLLTETELADILAECLGCERVYNLTSDDVKEEALACLPYAWARRLECLPVDFDESREKVRVVFADPSNQASVDAVTEQIGKPVIVGVGNLGEIHRCISDAYSPRAQFDEVFSNDRLEE